MSILKLDDFLNEAEHFVSLKGREFKINATFQSLLQYQAVLEKYNADQDEKEFSKSLGILIFGTQEEFIEFDTLLKNNFSPKKAMEMYGLVIKKWMEILNIEPNAIENSEEIKKKVSM